MKTQNGFTVIEVVVALSLGLLVTLAATQLFLTNQSTFNAQRGTVDLSANGRIALDQLARSVRQAGFYQPDIAAPADPAVLPASAAEGYTAVPTIGTDNYLALGTLLSGDGVTTVADDVGVVGPSDRLVVQYMAVDNTVDCEGTAILRGFWVAERYFIVRDTDGSPSLACDGNDPQQVGTVLARGVESFQILLGIDGNKNTRTEVTQYLTVAAYNALPPAPTPPFRPPVLAVRVGMLVRSEQPVLDMPAPQRDIYVLQSQIAVDDLPKDRRLRRVFTSTIGVNNANFEEV